jgi:hypothetical protein
MNDIIGYGLMFKMMIGDTSYSNYVIITSELMDIASFDVIAHYAKMMDRQMLDKCGQVLPTREWTCRPLWQMI